MFINSDAPVSDDLSSYYAETAAAWGYLPNFARAFGWHPEIARAWSALSGAIAGAMDRRRYELVTIGAARELRSTYCTLAHARFLRDDCGDAATVETIAGVDSRPLDGLDAALMEFGAKVARDASGITEEDIDERSVATASTSVRSRRLPSPPRPAASSPRSWTHSGYRPTRSWQSISIPPSAAP